MSGVSRYAGTPLLAILLLVPVTGSPLAAQERGWIGVQMMCTEPCGDGGSGGSGWDFSIPPMIAQVVPGSPADRAGIVPGDTVLSIDGIAITAPAAGRRLYSLLAGQPVDIVIRRKGRDLNVRLTPASQREAFGEARGPLDQATSDWNALSMRLKELYREQMGLQRALRRAEQVWERTHNEEVLAWTEQQREVAEQMRRQIDSTWRQMVLTQRRLVDSLAARTLYVRSIDPDSLAVVRIRPSSPATVGTPSAPTIAVFYQNAVAGARFESCTESWKPILGVGEGLLVLQVVEGTPAHQADLRVGDVVVSVNDVNVTTVEDFREEFRKALQDSRAVVLEIVRQGKRETLRMASR